MHTWKQAEEAGVDVMETLKRALAESNGQTSGKRWFTKLHLTLLALPHYWAMKLIARKLTKGSVFYDSILFGFTLFLLPLYGITLLGLLLYFIL
jgi:hypothetical protein